MENATVGIFFSYRVMMIRHRQEEIVNNVIYNRDLFDWIRIELMVQYELHSDHRHEINYTIVHNKDAQLEFIINQSVKWKSILIFTTISEHTSIGEN